MGPKVEFNMLPFIMFDSTSGLGHGNNSEPRKWYIAPRSRYLNVFKGKKEDFGLLSKSFKK